MTLFDYREAAAELRLAPITLRRWVSENRIEHIKLGSRVYFKPESIREYIDRHTIPAGGHR
ncbi:helix-turn-helix domain-containing protein [Marispirochaeta aestuarii]|uniref:helix-turn-helix domain-containing protein n=1 Tax=Marispirochaeta aestuarii TaxID=1963862 RepID=UPI0029C86BA9|nr:helix-turn-helix domain-containing protein [Marispirochaeta aestuarii]